MKIPEVVFELFHLKFLNLRSTNKTSARINRETREPSVLGPKGHIGRKVTC